MCLPPCLHISLLCQRVFFTSSQNPRTFCTREITDHLLHLLAIFSSNGFSAITAVTHNEARINLLRKLRSKMYLMELESYYDCFDIPRAFTLLVPRRNQAVYDHSGVIASMYIRHLEYGLHLPLHPFLHRTFEALGVSPSQIKPNSMATLVGFMVIYHRWESNRLSRFSATFSASRLGRTRAITTSRIWAASKSSRTLLSRTRTGRRGSSRSSGADPILACSAWPEIKKDVLRLGLLTAEEKHGLKRIRAYAGSHRIENLFNPLTLRAVGISGTPPTEEDMA